MENSKKNDFALWAKLMGYHGKQIDEAARSLGYGKGARLQEKAELDITLRLAMAAKRAGLEPWTMEKDGEIAAFLPTAAFRWSDSVQALVDNMNAARRAMGNAGVALSAKINSLREVTTEDADG